MTVRRHLPRGPSAMQQRNRSRTNSGLGSMHCRPRRERRSHQGMIALPEGRWRKRHNCSRLILWADKPKEPAKITSSSSPVRRRLYPTSSGARNGSVTAVRLPRCSRFESVTLRTQRGFECRDWDHTARKRSVRDRTRRAGDRSGFAASLPVHLPGRRSQAVLRHKRKPERQVLCGCMVLGCRSGATVAATLVAIAALIVSIWAGRRAARKREFEVLLGRIDRETTKREAETRAVMDRIDREADKRGAAIRELMDCSDRKFEALQRRSDELYRQSAEVTARVAHEGLGVDPCEG